jgi:hypothetical protein
VSSVAGLGLRVKTARAVAVVVAGDPGAPAILVRRELPLFDPDVPESRQPFHAGLGLPGAEARPIVERASDAVRRGSRRALGLLLDELATKQVRCLGVALVRASDTDPSAIANPHMHAHAAEGRLFHDALAEAARAARLPVRSLLEKRAVLDAARELGRRESSIQRAIAALGRQVGPPWRSDEKSACVAAWLALSGRGLE